MSSSGILIKTGLMEGMQCRTMKMIKGLERLSHSENLRAASV